jgi:hypothetical protein
MRTDLLIEGETLRESELACAMPNDDLAWETFPSALVASAL